MYCRMSRLYGGSQWDLAAVPLQPMKQSRTAEMQHSRRNNLNVQ
jgi:hypothetical protein